MDKEVLHRHKFSGLNGLNVTSNPIGDGDEIAKLNKKEALSREYVLDLQRKDVGKEKDASVSRIKTYQALLLDEHSELTHGRLVAMIAAEELKVKEFEAKLNELTDLMKTMPARLDTTGLHRGKMSDAEKIALIRAIGQARYNQIPW